MSVVESIDKSVEIIEEVLPQAGGIVLDIGRVNDYLCEIPALKARIEELEEAERFLNALEAQGVNNWEGYEHAQESLG